MDSAGKGYKLLPWWVPNNTLGTLAWIVGPCWDDPHITRTMKLDETRCDLCEYYAALSLFWSCSTQWLEGKSASEQNGQALGSTRISCPCSSQGWNTDTQQLGWSGTEVCTWASQTSWHRAVTILQICIQCMESVDMGKQKKKQFTRWDAHPSSSPVENLPMVFQSV